MLSPRAGPQPHLRGRGPGDVMMGWEGAGHAREEEAFACG